MLPELARSLGMTVTQTTRITSLGNICLATIIVAGLLNAHPND
jgi:hypothetical protein